jgi:cytidine deaminase
VTGWVENQELFLGLIAPIGVDLNAVQTALERALDTVAYRTSIIRLTDSLHPNHEELRKLGLGLFERYGQLIQSGNKLRSDTEADVFAYLAIQEIIRRRMEANQKTTERRVTVLRQFKRKEEVELLKRVYGNSIIFVSCYAPRSLRIKYFVDQLVSESRTRSRTDYEAQALQLIAKDEHQADDPNGQRLLDTYALADFVLDCSTPQNLTASATRLVEAFFDYPFISPSLDEYGAFMAHSASLRSTDLSRQVGAAIFQPSGEVVSMGCNEVPKFGGGTYWTSDPNDARDFRVGHDSNAKIKDDLINDTLTHLVGAGWQAPTIENPDALEGAMIQDLLEFGRVIHAEMNALCDASRFGRATRGATLYCTTLPCHMCSRHIVAAGISRVVYLQPYHKSLARELYPDSIVFEDGGTKVSEAVAYSSFAGVTPIAYQRVFSKGRRKNEKGTAVEWKPTQSTPIGLGSPEYLNLESVALLQFDPDRFKRGAEPELDGMK